MSELNQRIANLSPEKRALLERKLAAASAARSCVAPIVRNPNAAPVPSFGQEILWAMEQLETGTAQYNEGFALTLRGSLDAEALQRALCAVVQRHETLRSRYTSTADGRLQLEFTPADGVQLALLDYSGEAPDIRQQRFVQAMRAEANWPIDLGRDPVIRAVLYKLRPEEHVLQITMHHVATDGWSVNLMFRDLAAYYNEALTGVAAQLPDLPIAFSDYARWQREQLAGAEGQRLLAYWKQQLQGSSFVLHLPTDRPRPAHQAFRGSVRRHRMPAALAEELNHFCLKEQVTPFMVMLAVFYAVMGRYTGQKDVIVGSPIAARSRIETEDLIAYLTNTVLMRGNLEGDPSFRELLRRVRQTALDAYAHQDLPLELLIKELAPERDATRNVLFQVMLVFQNAPPHRLDFHGLEVALREERADSSKIDFMIELTPAGDSIDAVIEYNTDLFDAATIDRLWGHLIHYVQRAMKNPEEKAAAIPLLTEAERQQLLVEWNSTTRPYPESASLQSLVEAQVLRSPDAVALVDSDRQLTYRELNERANQLAHELQKHGAAPGQLVGFALSRSTELVVAMLAIVKSGAAYLPLDTFLPADRLRFMIEESGLQLLVTQRSVLSGLPVADAAVVLLEDECWHTNKRSNPGVASSPLDPAYVMYTSGSTGKPKGVQIPRRALTNLLWAMRDELQMSAQDRILAVTTVSFDIAGTELWLPLLVGAQVVIASREAAFDGAILMALLEEHAITCFQATPVTWRLLLESGWRGKRNLQAICTGEAMPQELATQLLPLVGRLWNLYGPTETTIWSTAYRVITAAAPILIGRPIANTQCYILDSLLQPVPIGVTGELFIAGDGVALGYLHRPDLTAEKFLPDPFRGAGRMYCTGDLARYRSDGNIECLGRVDHQVKIRGYRIELGEIEAVLEEQPEVEQAVVIAREASPGDKRLLAFLVARAGCKCEPAELRRRLRQSLPNYMVPSAFRFLERLPLSPSGKIDRKALPETSETSGTTREDRETPMSPLEQRLASIWAETLDLPEVGLRDDFFELGGNSLQAVRLFTRISQSFPELKPSFATLLNAPTVGQFAHNLATLQENVSCLVKVRDGNGRPPLFCVHGAGGNVLSLRELAAALPADLPFYCLQARGLDGRQAPFTSVEETAAHYVEEVRRVQPHGPYHVGGGCYGGVVAFEMARQLQAMGETVALVALIDTQNSSFGKSLSRPKLLYLNLRFVLRRVSHHMRVLGRMKPRDWWSYFLRKARILRRLLLGLFGAGAPEGKNADLAQAMPSSDDSAPNMDAVLDRIRDASVLAARTYEPKPYDGDVMVFTASLREDDPYRDDALGWRAVVLGGATAYEIEADHVSIFHEPAVGEVARRIDEALRAKHSADCAVADLALYGR